jgi:hypothetical protein
MHLDSYVCITVERSLITALLNSIWAGIPFTGPKSTPHPSLGCGEDGRGSDDLDGACALPRGFCGQPSTPYPPTPHLTPQTLTPQPLNSKPSTPNLKPQNPNPKLYTLHPTPPLPNPAPSCLNPTHQTLHSTPCTLHPAPQPPNPTP